MAERDREQPAAENNRRPTPEITPVGGELTERKPAPGPHWQYSEFQRPQPNTQRQEPGIDPHAIQSSFLPDNEAIVQREQPELDVEPADEEERRMQMLRTNPVYPQTQMERRHGTEEADPDVLSPEQESPEERRHGSQGADKPFSQTER